MVIFSVRPVLKKVLGQPENTDHREEIVVTIEVPGRFTVVSID